MKWMRAGQLNKPKVWYFCVGNRQFFSIFRWKAQVFCRGYSDVIVLFNYFVYGQNSKCIYKPPNLSPAPVYANDFSWKFIFIESVRKVFNFFFFPRHPPSPHYTLSLIPFHPVSPFPTFPIFSLLFSFLTCLKSVPWHRHYLYYENSDIYILLRDLTNRSESSYFLHGLFMC